MIWLPQLLEIFLWGHLGWCIAGWRQQPCRDSWAGAARSFWSARDGCAVAKTMVFFLTHQFLERWKTMDKVCLEVDIYPKSVVSSIVKLVGGFKHEFYCPFHIWDVILPIDEVIYFKMVKITNQLLKYTICRPRVHNYCFSVEWVQLESVGKKTHRTQKKDGCCFFSVRGGALNILECQTSLSRDTWG